MTRLMICLAVALLVVTGCDTSPTQVPRPASARPTSLVQDLAWAPVVLADRCPPVRKRLPFPPGGHLPDGANLVRLCNGPTIPDLKRNYRYDVPEDVLTSSDVNRLIDQVNRLELPPAPPSGQRAYCADDGGTAIDFWFGYPDGTAAAVRWEPFSCRLLQVAKDRKVEGGRDLLRSFAEALAKQRAGSHAVPSSPPPPHCSTEPRPRSPLGYPEVGDLAAVRLCVATRGGEREAWVPAHLVHRINEEIASGHRGRGCVRQGAGSLSAMSSSVDHVMLFGTRHCGWTLPVLPDTGEPWPSWRPSTSLARALDRLPLGPLVPQ